MTLPSSIRKQMMEIEIKFAKGKLDYVNVHFGDDPLTLAKDFVQKHNLKPSSVQIIAQYIEQTITDFIENHAKEENEEEETGHNDEEKDEINEEQVSKLKKSNFEEIPQSSADRRPSTQSEKRRGMSDDEEPVQSDRIDSRPLSTLQNNQHSKDQEDNYLGSGNMSNRMPPPSPWVGSKAVRSDQQNHPREERVPSFKTSSSVKSFPDDASNDTTVPIHTISKDTFDQSVYGHSIASASEKSSMYYQKTTNGNAIFNPIARSSPSLPDYGKSSPMKMNREDDSNTIDEVVDKSLFLSNSSGRSRSGSRINQLKKEESGKLSSRGGSPANSAYDDRKQSTATTPILQLPGKSNFNPTEVVDQRPISLSTSASANADFPKTGEFSDDYTYRSDLASFVTGEQESITNKTNTSSNDNEDPEAKFNRLKFATIKRTQSNVTTSSIAMRPGTSVKTTLKPAAKSLQMGNQKLNGTKSLNTKGSKGINSPNHHENRNKFIGTTVNERLYYNADLMKKKKDFLHQKAEEKKLEQIQSEQFHLNDMSQRILEHISHSNRSDQDSQASVNRDIGQKLYAEGVINLENRKKKSDNAEKAKENRIEDWSCVKCGTFHKIPTSKLSAETPLMWDRSNEDRYICSKCSFNNKDKVQSFKPTNIGFLYNEEVKGTFDSRSYGDNSKNVYDHLYSLGKQQDSMLQLNRALWEDIQEKMYFKPEISEKSKAIIKTYKHQALQEKLLPGSMASESVDSQGKLESGLVLEEDQSLSTATSTTIAVGKTKISGPAMKEYFSKPTFDRLTTTNTRSYAQEAIAQQKQHNNNNFPKAATFASSKISNKSSSVFGSLAENPKAQQEDLVNRLVYEYKDKNHRIEARSNQYYTIDDKTGQKLFQPKVPILPTDVFPGGVRVQSGNSDKKDIWNDILRRDQELLEEKQKRQRQAIEKTLEEIQKNQVKALPNSNEILQSSTTKNIEDLFKLLLVSTHPSYEHDGTTEDQHTAHDSSSITSIVTPSQKEEGETFKFKDEKEEARYSSFYKKDNPLRFSEDGSLINSSSIITADNNTIISEKQINDLLTHHLKDWKEKSLDLLLIKPNLLINEISTLLLDMKHTLFEKWLGKQRLKQVNQKNSPVKQPETAAKDGTVEEGEDANVLKTTPDQLLITYDEFVKLALKCIKQRSGPGKGYIFAPKKKADVALQMKLQEYSEETFHPEIDKVSEAIVQKHVRENKDVPNVTIPIEEVLAADGQRVQQKIENLRKQKALKEEKELTFKPQLYKPPSYITPRYRGLDISDFEENENEGENNSFGGNDVDPFHAALKKPLNTAEASSNASSANAIAGSIYDIPNVLISSKTATGGPATTIRGGGGGGVGGGGGGKKEGLEGKTPAENGGKLSVSNPSTINRFTEPTPSTVPAETSITSPISKQSNKHAANTLMTPPQVRQSRLLNQQLNFHEPPVPPPVRPPVPSSIVNNSTNQTVVTTDMLAASSPQKIPPSIPLKNDSNSTYNSFDFEDFDHRPRQKDDISIFSLTESASSIVVVKSPIRTKPVLSAEKTNKREKGHENQPSSSSFKEKLKSTNPAHRIDSSSQDSVSPPMSISSNGSHQSEKHSIDFPSKFSAVSEVSHSHADNSGSEIDDRYYPYNKKKTTSTSHARYSDRGNAGIPPAGTSKMIEVGTRKPDIVINTVESIDSGSSLTGYSANISSGGNLSDGYGKKLQPNQLRKGKVSSYSGNYVQSHPMAKALPLLPHELAKQQGKPGRRSSFSLESESLQTESTLSTESSTIIKDKKKLR